VQINTGYAFGTVVAGGYVFYNNGSGGGLVAAMSDLGTVAWIEGGATQTTANNGTSIDFFTGLSNSNAIVAQTDHSASAAKLCLDYSDGTYSDWYLPSRLELDKMYANLRSNSKGNFSSASYWSSSEVNANSALSIGFYVPGPPSFNNDSKSTATKVRAIRNF
jgi:hypothetical protein